MRETCCPRSASASRRNLEVLLAGAIAISVLLLFGLPAWGQTVTMAGNGGHENGSDYTPLPVFRLPGGSPSP